MLAFAIAGLICIVAALCYAEASGGGLVAANGHVAITEASPTIRARLNGNATVSGVLTVEADSVGRAVSTTESKAGGLAGVGGGLAEATLSPDVSAGVDSGDLTAGSVVVRASHNFGNDADTYRAYAKTEAASISGLDIQVNDTEAIANANVPNMLGQISTAMASAGPRPSM